MTSASAIEFGRPAVRRQSLWRYWQGRLRGSEFTWAVAFLVPYIGGVPGLRGLSGLLRAVDGQQPALYTELFSDPIYQQTVVNTLIFLAFGVNLKLFLALLMSGFFMRPGWWIKGAADDLRPALGGAGTADFHLDPLDAERRVGPAQQRSCTLSSASRGRPGSMSAGSPLVRPICSHIWKWLPFWTVILLAGRMSIPQDIYDAAKVDGATGLRRFTHVTFPAARQSLSGPDPAGDDLSAWRLQFGLLRHRRRAGQFDACAGDARHPQCL